MGGQKSNLKGRVRRIEEKKSPHKAGKVSVLGKMDFFQP